MVRRLSLLAGVVLLVSLSAQAQGLDDKFEVFGGYSYLRVNNSPSANLNGWELSGNYKFAGSAAWLISTAITALPMDSARRCTHFCLGRRSRSQREFRRLRTC